MAFWCLFDFIIREIGSTIIVLGHSPLEVTSKKLGEEKAQFNCFDKSYIRGFSNTWYQVYSKI